MGEWFERSEQGKAVQEPQISQTAESNINHQLLILKMTEKFNVIVEQGEDGYLISEVVELPGCHTQAKTYDELFKRTKEVILLYLGTKKHTEIKTKFLGLQQIEV